MTQRIFDRENEKDMVDLWDIIPESIVKIRKGYKTEDGYYYNYYDTNYIEGFYESAFLLIDWHDKTEITRPIQEATEADIGKLCYFWEKDFDKHFVGLLGFIDNTSDNKKYQMLGGYWWSHARCLTKQEIEELC